MEQLPDHSTPIGPPNILLWKSGPKVGSNTWGIPSGRNTYQTSSDASLFSTSLPVLSHEKLTFGDSNHVTNSPDDKLPKLDKLSKDLECRESSKDDLNLQGIGVLLPDDEEELLAGLTDDFDLNGLPIQLEELEDYDLFGSGGGMELDSDPVENITIGMAKAGINDGYGVNGIGHYSIPNGVGTVAGEHPYGEHPSRTLFVRNINSNVEDSELRSLFEENDGKRKENNSEVKSSGSLCESLLFSPSISIPSELSLDIQTWQLDINMGFAGLYPEKVCLEGPLQYGDIRTLYTACKHRGFVMISYYDIRDARSAMRALQNKPLRRRKLDIHFSIPKDNPSDKDMNQGTLVVFNLDPSVSNDDLRQIFGAYGEVKEIRETPHKRHHKFVEFYDVRAAEAALRSLNRSDIAGKRIKLEPSRPGGARRNLMQQLSQELEQDDIRSYRHHVGSPIGNSPPGTWAQFGSPNENNQLQVLSNSPTAGTIGPMGNNSLPGLASVINPLVSNSMKIAPIGKDQSRINHADQVLSVSNQTHAFQHSHSFPEHTNGMTPNMSSSPGTASHLGHSTSAASGIGTLTGPQFLWGSPTPYSEHSQSSAWPSPSVGRSFTSNGQMQGPGFPYSNHHGSFISPSNHHHHHVGSAPSGFPFERPFGYFPESPESSFMSQIAFGSISAGRNEGSMMMGARAPMNHGSALPGSISQNSSPSYRMMSSPRFGHAFFGTAPYHGPGSIGVEGFVDRGRTRRVDNNGGQLDNKKQYHLDLEKIISGEDTRTTLMIKNIPNKYTSKMLLAAIDENHKGTYDFLYLPIDFKNKCNVGYAFINMLSPTHIVSFYQAFNGKKWEKFNSEKVASLAYARIQGKSALVAHFQNSSLMNEDKRCRPILFHSEGPEAGDQEPFPPNAMNVYVSQQEESSPRDLPPNSSNDPSEKLGIGDLPGGGLEG